MQTIELNHAPLARILARSPAAAGALSIFDAAEAQEAILCGKRTCAKCQDSRLPQKFQKVGGHGCREAVSPAGSAHQDGLQAEHRARDRYGCVKTRYTRAVCRGSTSSGVFDGSGRGHHQRVETCHAQCGLSAMNRVVAL